MILLIGVLLAIEVSNPYEVRLEKRAERVLIERLLEDAQEVFARQKATDCLWPSPAG